MSKPRVLVDLSLAHNKMGFSGIPQDARFLFDRLGMAENLDADGLVFSNSGSWHDGDLNSLESQANFVGSHLHAPVAHRSARVAGRINGRLGSALERLVMGRIGKGALYPLKKELREIIWREFLSGSIEANRRVENLKRNYMLSPLGLWTMVDAAYFGLSAVKMDTRGYDYVVFQDSRKIIVSPESQKVIRYHDGLPVFAADTMRNRITTKIHIRGIQSCADDSLFVCNSTSSVDDLHVICPKAAEKATVIPYFVPPTKPTEPTAEQLFEILTMRISPSTLPNDKSHPKGKLISDWFSLAKKGRLPRFIMTLSTIEPRKNIPALISAWQRLRDRQPDLRLLIAGKPGWEFEKSLAAIRPFVELGQIVHVEGVAQRELSRLYSAAACFVFPSFGEGFGLPPVEAMQCGCPVVVSDIPAHRYMAGDAALYCDPYDRGDIADKIEAALAPEKAKELREAGLKNAERYTIDAVLPQWETFFEKHKK